MRSVPEEEERRRKEEEEDEEEEYVVEDVRDDEDDNERLRKRRSRFTLLAGDLGLDPSRRGFSRDKFIDGIRSGCSPGLFIHPQNRFVPSQISLYIHTSLLSTLVRKQNSDTNSIYV